MSLTVNFKSSSTRMIDNCDIGNGSGMLGESIVLNIEDDISLVPGVSFSDPNRMLTYYNIRVVSGSSRSVTLPAFSEVASGFHCYITNMRNSVGIVTVLSSNLTPLININPGFTAFFISAGNTWIRRTLLPGVADEGNTVVYDASNSASLALVSTLLTNNGNMTARNTGSIPVTSTTDTIINFNSQQFIEPTTYTNLSGVFTVLRDGYYKINSAISIVSDGLTPFTATLVRLRIGAATYPRTFSSIANHNVPINTNIYNIDANIFLSAGTTFQIVVSQTNPTIGNLNTDAGNCWIDARYIGPA